MKKLLLSLITSGAALYVSAQSPTMDFEAWTGAAAAIEPTGWVSGNAVTVFPFSNPQSVFRTISPDIHGGVNAMRVTSVALTNNPAPGQLPNPIGLCATGTISFSPLGIEFGYPYTSRPGMVSFWYKYTPNGADSAGLFMALTKWNISTSKRDTIAIGYWITKTTVSTFTQQDVSLTYSLTSIPDSATLIFSSTSLFNTNYSLCMTCGKTGSSLWVDDITFSGWIGIDEHSASNNASVYPNPANNYINIAADATEASFVIVYDAAGKKVVSTAMNGTNRKEAVINTSSLAAGLYSYQILDKDGISLIRGKFSVLR